MVIPLRFADPKRPGQPLRFRFSKRELDRLEPTDRRRLVYDSAAAGLAMQITPTGRRAFYLNKRIGGRYRRIKIGDFPGVTVEQARKQAAKLKGEIASGENPAERRREARDAMTLGDLFGYYLSHHARPHKRTWKNDERQYKLHLKQWAGRRLNQIKRQDVAALHARMGKTRPTGANRLLALVSKMFSVAAELGYEGPNPARGVKRFAEHSRRRFLDASEMPLFLAALEAEESETLRDYVKLLLLTGQRRGNMASLRWEEVDFKRRVWTIPPEKFKSGSTHEVPLVDEALVVLRSRRGATGEEWAFPNRRRNPRRPHLREPGQALSRICERAGIKDVKPHDLRRTVASWATMQGVPYPVVARMLGHRVYGVTGIYARFDLSAVREGFERTVAAMLAAGKAEEMSGP